MTKSIEPAKKTRKVREPRRASQKSDRTSLVGTTLTPEEKEAFQKIARSAELPVGILIRQLILQRMGRLAR